MSLDLNLLIGQFIAALPATIAAVTAMIYAIKSAARVQLVEAKVETVVVAIDQVHKSTNSMKDALVQSTRRDALQEGHAAGVKDQKIEAAAQTRAAVER